MTLLSLLTIDINVVKDIVAGDQVFGGDVIECVIRSDSFTGMHELVHLTGSEGVLKITRNHPVLLGGCWTLPIRVPGATVHMEPCGSVYNFILRNRSECVVVNGFSCITLAHGIENDTIAKHPLFGTEKCVDMFSACKGWTDGLIVLTDEDNRTAEELICISHILQANQELSVRYA